MKKTIRRRMTLALSMLLLSSLPIAPAQAKGGVVHDLRGDVAGNASYLDVAHAQVTYQREDDVLLFKMVLADPVPDRPPAFQLLWPFHVDTAPGAVGDPLLYNEYVVRVQWLSDRFQGHVVNRTPGGTSVAVPFAVEGATVKAFVPRSLLGSPSRFGWNASTRIGREDPDSTTLGPYVDFAPDAKDNNDPDSLASWTE